MYKIIRYFNQNRKKIFFIVTIIAFGIIILQFINFMVSINNENQQNNLEIKENETIIKNNINVESAITGQGGGKNSQLQTDTIEEFIQYCNQGQISEAYKILSTECKEKMYPTLEKFVETYYRDNFQESKTYNIQRWSSSLYKVDFKQNMLHTGKVTSTSKQDFINVIYEENEYKLNINNYIGRTTLNKQNKTENIIIDVLHKDIFKDYETYTFEVKNNSDIEIYLDNLKNTSTIYIIDENNIKHFAYINEIGQEELHIYPHTKKQIEITFSNSYITGRMFNAIIFENVILEGKTDDAKKVVIDLR